MALPQPTRPALAPSGGTPSNRSRTPPRDLSLTPASQTVPPPATLRVRGGERPGEMPFSQHLCHGRSRKPLRRGKQLTCAGSIC